MPQSYTQLYLHLVWSTWERHPLITPELQPRIYSGIQHQARKMGVEMIAVGGICDHVHVLIRFPPAVAVTTIVGPLKGASSHLVTHVIRSPDAFRWQGGYGAFTVSRFGISRVRDYVLDQERHHREGTLIEALEATE